MKFDLNYEENVYNDILTTIQETIKLKIDTTVTKLNISGYVTKEPIPFNDRKNGVFKKMDIGYSWGKLFDCAWFLIEGEILNFDNSQLYLKVDVSGEACLFNEEGIPIKGFTNGSSVFDRDHGEPGKAYYLINDFIKPDGCVEFWVEAGCNDLFGNWQNNGKLVFCEIVKRNEEIKELYYDMEVLFSLFSVINKDTIIYNQLLEGLKNIHYLVLYEENNWVEKALEISKSLLNQKSSNPLKITAIGHSHIDLAWLWPIRETKRKISRTFSNVIDLLERDDEFIFGVSQPQLLLWTKEEYPHLYEKMKKYIKEGRIEVQGGMWVEADTNVSGEEALVRQMLYGIKFYQDEFDIRVKNLWLPDVFGYNGNLPQIIKKSGLDYFMTIKLSWNLINKFPYNTFNWYGIDGTNVLCHMPPEGNYNSSMLPRVVKKMEENYKEKHLTNKALALFGIGDGGGGPGNEHIERINRQKSLNPLPRIKYGRSDEFFNEIELKKASFPNWKGELYLENHQGTYTSQANVKFYNRKLENKLKAVETLLVSGGIYKQYENRLRDIWKEVLLYQFHDILPGSSIKRVYDECLARYKVLDLEIDDIIKNGFNHYEIDHSSSTIHYNPLLFDVNLINKVRNKYHIQKVSKLSTKILQHDIYGQDQFTYQGIIETNILKVVFNQDNGQIASIIDKKCNREILSKSEGNKLSVYQDKGDAWNILDHYRKQTPTNMKLLNSCCKKYGSVFEITNEYQFKQSSLKEVVLIKEDSRVIYFKHELDWKNVGFMLRTSFPLNIKSHVANFDIQFGQISRSRLNNTSIDCAQFEMCGHNWVDVSEYNYGVSMINNSKYGYYVKEDMLDMNLLRSTNYPCENGDIDKNEYTYGLYIHEGNHNEAHVDQLAMQLNTFFPKFSSCIDLKENWLTLDKDNITYSTIKNSEDNEGTIIRLYEINGAQTHVCIKLLDEFVKKVYITNLVEEIVEEITSDKGINLIFKPYEIITLKVVHQKK